MPTTLFVLPNRWYRLVFFETVLPPGSQDCCMRCKWLPFTGILSVRNYTCEQQVKSYNSRSMIAFVCGPACSTCLCSDAYCSIFLYRSWEVWFSDCINRVLLSCSCKVVFSTHLYIGKHLLCCRYLHTLYMVSVIWLKVIVCEKNVQYNNGGKYHYLLLCF